MISHSEISRAENRRRAFQKTMEDARNGSDIAFQVLVDKYGKHIKRYLKRQISYRLQAKVDESDVAQMVWASFFDHRSQVLQFEESQDMIAYLVKMASFKVKGEANRYAAEKRAVRREHSLDESMNQDANLEHDTPSQFAICHERLDQILDGLSDRDQQIICMRMSGVSRVEIADELNISEAAIRKVLAKVAERGLRDLETPNDRDA